MACAEGLRLAACFDGEVDALAAAALERHLEDCRECREQLASLEQTRAALHRHLPLEQTPAALRARLGEALDRQEPAGRRRARAASPLRLQSFWLGALGGAGVTALAAAALMLCFVPGQAGTVEALEAAHVRSLMPAHLLDVASSERHTVKPWFAGHADVSPVVGDFPEAGYQLLGGRADYLWRQRAAVLVYRHGAHVINVFSWAAGPDRLPRQGSRAGYHILCWRAADLGYCAVSDSGWQELSGLAQRLQELAARDASRE
jgi:anti-sigma factor RsiW